MNSPQFRTVQDDDGNSFAILEPCSHEGVELNRGDANPREMVCHKCGQSLGFVPRNPSGIIPTGYKVLVKSEESVEEQKLKSMGLIAAETTKERLDAQSVIGRLIAVSPLAFTYHEGWSKEDQPKPGQRVVYGKYSGTTLKGKDDVDYRLVNDQDIGAVLEF